MDFFSLEIQGNSQIKKIKLIFFVIKLLEFPGNSRIFLLLEFAGKFAGKIFSGIKIKITQNKIIIQNKNYEFLRI